MRAWFTANHDENSWNGTEYEKYGVITKPMAVFSATWNGVPLLYSGQELPNMKRLEFFEKDAIILDQLASKSVKLLSKKSGKGLEFDFADFENLVLWSTNNKGPFIALEPWTGISTSAEEGDFFENKKGVIQLDPQETRSHQYRITIL